MVGVGGGGGGGGGEMGFKHGDEIGVSSVEMPSMPLYAKVDPFFSSADWDHTVMSTMVSSNGFSNPHYPSLVVGNPGMSDFAHCPPDSVSGSGYVDMSQRLLLYEGTMNKAGESSEHQEVSEEGVLGACASQNKKRRRPEIELAPSLQWNKKAVEEFQKDVARGNLDVVQEQSLKKTESEQNTVENSRGKIPSKDTTNKNSAQSGEAPKENYIHVRARRGQATNSHSLAERVRREKISERMRLLQELVPGCNKITGKAVMLDEIINYVQSLQQQVEFLSMKLATVNPELNINIERILGKDVLHSRDRNSQMFDLGAGMNPSHPYSVIQGTMPSIPITSPQFNPLSQVHTVLDSELQSLYQMGFVSNSSSMDSFSPNGRLKPEL